MCRTVKHVCRVTIIVALFLIAGWCVNWTSCGKRQTIRRVTVPGWRAGLVISCRNFVVIRIRCWRQESRYLCCRSCPTDISSETVESTTAFIVFLSRKPLNVSAANYRPYIQRLTRTTESFYHHPRTRNSDFRTYASFGDKSHKQTLQKIIHAPSLRGC